MSDSRAECKCIGYIDNIEKMQDQTIEFDETDKTSGSKCLIGLHKYGDYLTYAKACICNVSAGHLLKNRKLPVYYMVVLYSKQFVSGGLFTLFLYFTIDDDTMKVLTGPNKYVNRVLTGKYTLELVSDDGFLGQLIEKRKPIIENMLMEKYVEEFDLLTTDDDKEKLMDKIMVETNNKLDEYRQLFEVTEMNVSYLKAVVKKMKSIVQSEIFKDLIIEGLNIREEERKQKNCPDLDFKPPKTKNIINLKELKEHPEKIDDIINRLSEPDSDDD
jgi:hypothetical protein